MLHLLDQALKHQFPKHPQFGQEIKVGKDLRDVLAVCQEATHTQDGRIYVEEGRIRKAIKNICDPLELGFMGETHFKLGTDWKSHFNKCLAASEKQNPDVADLRQWINYPDRRGLPKEIQNLLILVFAEQTNRSFVQYGGAYVPKLDDMPNDLELREEALPPEADWQETRKRVADLFGDDISRLLNASNLMMLADKFTKDGADITEDKKGHIPRFKPNCDSLPDRLQLILTSLGISQNEASTCDRVKTAKAARKFFAAIDGQAATPMVVAIAKASIETSGKAMARSIKFAASVLASLREPNRWELFEAVAQISDQRKTEARLLLDDVCSWLKMDEFALAGGLPDKLSEAEGRAIRLLKPPKPVEPGPEPEPTPPPQPGWRRVDAGKGTRLSRVDLEAMTNELLGKLEANPKYRVSIQWTLEEGESK